MKIYPAIDIYEGKVVRLQKGDFAQQTVYGDDPLAVAKAYAAQGARHLHVVDLSGAKDPARRQVNLIRSIVQGTPLKVQTGGGIRQLQDVEDLVAAGVDRVILGSLALTNRALCETIFSHVGAHHLTLALDVRIDSDGQPLVATGAWEKTSQMTIADVVALYGKYPLDSVLCTDINRDGMASGPNFSLYRTLREHHPTVGWLASGGVARAADVAQARELGLAGIIIGKALYEGNFTLKEVLDIC